MTETKTEKKRKRKRSRSRSRESRYKENPEDYTLRGRRRRRPRYWDMTPEVAHSLGLPMNRQVSGVPSATLNMPAVQPSAKLDNFGEAKIYCGFGALNFNPSEEELKEFFNVTMVAAQ